MVTARESVKLLALAAVSVQIRGHPPELVGILKVPTSVTIKSMAYDWRNRAAKIKKQLGMSYGTALHQLRKAILFRLAVAAKMDLCFRCGSRIESVQQFTVEHKRPWEDKSADLFWDQENVAFSHARCNRPHYLTGARTALPPGKSWCSHCKRFRSVKKFHKNSTRWNGLARQCKDCRKGDRHWRRIRDIRARG